MAWTRNSSAMVLTVHKVSAGRRLDHTCLRPDQLKGILHSLIESGREFTDLRSAIENPRSRQMAVTFDDGYAHLIEPLLALMDRFSCRPTVFIPTAFIGRKNSWDYTSIISPLAHLDRSKIRTLARAGVRFGSHGHTHRPLTGLNDSDLAMELQVSRSVLEDLTGGPADLISYPFGRFDGRVTKAAEEAGYQFGFGSHWPSEGGDNLAAGRITLYGWDTPYSALQKAGGRWWRVERAKEEATRFLSGGTALFQRLWPGE
ncbi:MAG: polysaccharide deacetylase family protein [candidate division Zixibacteria bacterium]|nr:polysaccharide deacetylase family protein [candidate division Zixibacteria bacterium]